MTDTAMTPFEQAERALRLRGVILRQGAGTYQIERGNLRSEFEHLEEAYAAGMAFEPPPAPTGRRKRPLSMRPKAIIKRRKRAHWNRMMARIKRGGLV